MLLFQVKCKVFGLSVPRCLLVILAFGLFSYDDYVTNDDPPVHVSQSWNALTRHCIETGLITCRGETVNPSTIDDSKLLSRAPP